MIEATGVLRGKTRRALDSTLLDDAVATQDTVTQLVGGDPAGPPGGPHSTRGRPRGPRLRRWGQTLIAWDDEVARGELVDALVNDARAVLDTCADVAEPESAAAIGLLALIAGQDVELDEMTASGASCAGSRRTASSRSSTPRPATCTRVVPNTATATRPIWPSSPRPGSSPRRH